MSISTLLRPYPPMLAPVVKGCALITELLSVLAGCPRFDTSATVLPATLWLPALARPGLNRVVNVGVVDYGAYRVSVRLQEPRENPDAVGIQIIGLDEVLELELGGAAASLVGERAKGGADGRRQPRGAAADGDRLAEGDADDDGLAGNVSDAVGRRRERFNGGGMGHTHGSHFVAGGVADAEPSRIGRVVVRHRHYRVGASLQGASEHADAVGVFIEAPDRIAELQLVAAAAAMIRRSAKSITTIADGHRDARGAGTDGNRLGEGDPECGWSRPTGSRHWYQPESKQSRHDRPPEKSG